MSTLLTRSTCRGRGFTVIFRGFACSRRGTAKIQMTIETRSRLYVLGYFVLLKQNNMRHQAISKVSGFNSYSMCGSFIRLGTILFLPEFSRSNGRAEALSYSLRPCSACSGFRFVPWFRAKGGSRCSGSNSMG